MCVRDLLFGIVPFGDVDGGVGSWALLGCKICCVTVSLASAGTAISGGGYHSDGYLCQSCGSSDQ